MLATGYLIILYSLISIFTVDGPESPVFLKQGKMGLPFMGLGHWGIIWSTPFLLLIFTSC
jgi:hypothetical protein